MSIFYDFECCVFLTSTPRRVEFKFRVKCEDEEKAMKFLGLSDENKFQRLDETLTCESKNKKTEWTRSIVSYFDGKTNTYKKDLITFNICGFHGDSLKFDNLDLNNYCYISFKGEVYKYVKETYNQWFEKQKQNFEIKDMVQGGSLEK